MSQNRQSHTGQTHTRQRSLNIDLQVGRGRSLNRRKRRRGVTPPAVAQVVTVMKKN